MGKGHIKNPKQLVCDHCNVSFIGKHYKSRFCCKDCRVKFTGERYKTTGVDKNATLMRRYGITMDIYDSMVENQKGVCHICYSKPTKLYVDHDHKTQRVRGLLCMKCNTGLGLFKDKADILYNAFLYLQDDIEELKKVNGA